MKSKRRDVHISSASFCTHPPLKYFSVTVVRDELLFWGRTNSQLEKESDTSHQLAWHRLLRKVTAQKRMNARTASLTLSKQHRRIRYSRCCWIFHLIKRQISCVICEFGRACNFVGCQIVESKLPATENSSAIAAACLLLSCVQPRRSMLTLAHLLFKAAAPHTSTKIQLKATLN